MAYFQSRSCVLNFYECPLHAGRTRPGVYSSLDIERPLEALAGLGLVVFDKRRQAVPEPDERLIA